MRCRFSDNELSMYLDKRFSAQKNADIESHLGRCQHCNERLHRLEAVRSSLHDLEPVKESEGFDFEFNRKLQGALAAQKARTWQQVLSGALANIKDNVLYPVPAMAKMAVSFVVVLAVISGIHAQSVNKLPFAEFVAGDVKIYRANSAKPITPKINMRLKPGDRIHSREGAVLNILSRNRYKARVKDESIIVISRLASGLRNIDTDFSISQGNLLVNTTDRFKGSRMRISTPSCNAEVVGTAFMVNVADNRTWLGVLEGKVKVTSKQHPLKVKDAVEATAYVSSGQKVVVEPYKYATVPELFSETEWQNIQELYQLQESPRVILLIGTGPDRIEQLLRPAPVYIPNIGHRTVPKDIEKLIDTMIRSAGADDIGLLSESLYKLRQLIEKYPDLEYRVELLMFMASNYYYIKDYASSLEIFDYITNQHPDSPLASLALCAIATIYQNDIKDTAKAQTAYNYLLKVYPDSIDAIRAKDILPTLY